MFEIVRGFYTAVSRKLDGKGRLMLPGDLREAAGFAPDEPVEVGLVRLSGTGKPAFIITRSEDKEAQHGRS